MNRSPMGIGSVVLAALAWLLVAIAFPLSVPHEFAAIAMMIALSGAAVAWEGRRVEQAVSPRLQQVGLFLNLVALAASALSIAIEVIRRRAR
jgi:hypothetical protein